MIQSYRTFLYNVIHFCLKIEIWGPEEKIRKYDGLYVPCKISSLMSEIGSRLTVKSVKVKISTDLWSSLFKKHSIQMEDLQTTEFHEVGK